jgi:hypothetical protein
MASLFRKKPPPAPDQGRSLPQKMRQLIVDLKAEHPGFTPHEIARICFLRFGRKPSDHSAKRVLADFPKPSVTMRRYPPYAEIADGYQRRRDIADLHAEGWSNTSFSAYLQTPRHRVYEVLKRWAQEGHAGLDDKPSTPHRPACKVGIREINEVGKLVVESPELGRTVSVPSWSKSESSSHIRRVNDCSPSIASSTESIPPKARKSVRRRRCPSKPATATGIGAWTWDILKSIT